MASCTSLVHFYPTFEIMMGEGLALVRSRAHSFAAIPVGLGRPAVSVSRGDHTRFPGWNSPEFGVKFPASVLALRWENFRLPWMGGLLISSGSGENFRRHEVKPEENLVRVEFSGKVYELQMK